MEEPPVEDPPVAAVARFRLLIQSWWVAPLGVYLVSRVLAFVPMWISSASQPGVGGIRGIARSWDGHLYVDVINGWYPSHLTMTDGHVGSSVHAFFPAYPLTARVISELTGLEATLVAMMVSLLCGAVASLLVFLLARRMAGDEVATRANLLFCFFPGAFVFNWAYSEAMMLAFVAASMYFIWKNRLLTAGVLAGFATFTRPNALAISGAFAWLALVALWTHRDRVRTIAAAALSICGFLAYQGYLWHRVGKIDAWFLIQREGFHEGVDPGHVTLRTMGDLLRSHFHSIPAMFTLFFLLLALALLIASFRAPVPGWMRVYVVLTLLLAVTNDTAPVSPRFVLAAFPGLIALAMKMRSQNLFGIWLAGCGAFGFVLVLAYSNNVASPYFMWAL